MSASYLEQLSHRFELVRRLGAGGMAVVYDAVDRATGARVALKALSAIDAPAKARFKREFRATQDLQHPNLVRLHELFEDGDFMYFTMDLVDGIDFLSFVRGGAGDPVVEDTLPLIAAVARAEDGELATGAPVLPCDERRLRDALAQLVRAVTALHDHALVHRDIKPSNILVTPDGDLRLLDFGLISDPALHSSFTGQIIGTAGYMAPEQADDSAVGPEADWYSVGVVLFEALTGRLPFTGSTIDILAHKRCYDPPAPRTVVLGVPPDLDRLCESLLSRDPARRPGRKQIAASLRLDDRAADRPAVQLAIVPVARTVFVGRVEERRWLQTQYQRARAGGTVRVSISGESGIGKSALVKQTLDELCDSEPMLVVLSGRCYEHESVSYKGVDGIVESLAAFLRRLPAEAAAALSPRHTDALALQFPALASVAAFTGAASVARAHDPLAARTEAMHALREVLQRLGDRHALVIWLEDLQWIDADGRVVLSELFRPPDAPRALVLVTHATPSAAPAVEPLPWTGEALALGPLARDDARALVEVCALRAGIALDERETGRLADEAQGHPIFLQELVHHAAVRGVSADPRPLLLDDVLGERIACLAPASLGLLEVASLAVGPVPLGVAAAAARLEAGPAVACVAQLRADRLLATSGTSAEITLQPSHDRVRRAVLGRLDRARVADWHRRIAVAFEASPTRDAEMLAMHWSQAGELTRAAPYAADAGFAAARAFAFDRAASLLRLALSGTAAGDARQHRLVALGEALANAGRGPESARIFLECAAGATSHDAVLALRHRAADQFLRSGHVDEGLEALEDLLRAVKVRLPRTPRAALVSLAYHRTRVALRGLDHVERAEADVPQAELRRLDVCYSVASGLSLVDLVRGADFQTRCLLLALDAGEPSRLSRALAMEASFAASEGGRSRRRVGPLFEAASVLVRKSGRPSAAGWLALAQGVAAMQEGRFADSLRFSLEAEALFHDRCQGVAWELTHARAFSIWSLVALGRLRELAAKVPDLVRDCRERGDRLGLMSLTCGPICLLALARDQAREMRVECTDSLENWAQGGFHFQHLCALFSLAAADLYEGRADAAVDRVESAWDDVERSLLLRVQFFRLDLWALRGRVALAAAGQDPRSPHARRVERAVARIERERMPWASGHAFALRAGLARLRSDLRLATALLEHAEQAFAGAAMSLHAAACQLQRGQVLGAAGAVASTQGDALLAAEGVVQPTRFAIALLPVASIDARWSTTTGGPA